MNHGFEPPPELPDVAGLRHWEMKLEVRDAYFRADSYRRVGYDIVPLPNDDDIPPHSPMWLSRLPLPPGWNNDVYEPGPDFFARYDLIAANYGLPPAADDDDDESLAADDPLIPTTHEVIYLDDTATVDQHGYILSTRSNERVDNVAQEEASAMCGAHYSSDVTGDGPADSMDEAAMNGYFGCSSVVSGDGSVDSIIGSSRVGKSASVTG